MKESMEGVCRKEDIALQCPIRFSKLVTWDFKPGCRLERGFSRLMGSTICLCVYGNNPPRAIPST